MKHYLLTVKGNDTGYAHDEVIKWLGIEPNVFYMDSAAVGEEVRIKLQVPDEKQEQAEQAFNDWFRDASNSAPYPSGTLLWWDRA